jgi:two-component system LytT family sensor kinase
MALETASTKSRPGSTNRLLPATAMDYEAEVNSPFSPPASPADIEGQTNAARTRAGATGDPFALRRDRLAVLSIMAFWAGYFVLASVKALISELPGQEDMAIRRLCVTLLAIGLTWALYLVLRRFQDWPTHRLIALAFGASVPLALAYAAINWTAFHYFPIEAHSGLMRSKEMSPLASIAWSALDWYFFIVCWAILWIAITYAAQVREAERTAARYARAAQEAELKALRYQINPHFLFNTLNSLSSLVMRGRRAEAEHMILNLSDFLRATLDEDPTADVPLAEEVEMQTLYLGIETLRFPGRLRTDFDIPDDLAQVPVPGLILQPLVENAVRYSVARSLSPVTITIRARRHGSQLVVDVKDDGPVVTTPIQGGCGVGLQNVRMRLAARFGAAANLEAGPMAPAGWRARVTLPILPSAGD